MSPERDETLRALLRQWTVDAPLPPRFQEQVWRRIDRSETEPRPAFWASFGRLVEVVLPRPRFALAYLAVLLGVGMVAGSWAAQLRTSRIDSVLSLRYVQSVDPYRTDHSQP